MGFLCLQGENEGYSSARAAPVRILGIEASTEGAGKLKSTCIDGTRTSRMDSRASRASAGSFHSQLSFAASFLAIHLSAPTANTVVELRNPFRPAVLAEELGLTFRRSFATIGAVSHTAFCTIPFGNSSRKHLQRLLFRGGAGASFMRV